jgi:hypothetical protein
MPLSYVLDEHLRGVLWKALQQHNAAGSNCVDVVRVGDSADLPLSTPDPDLLLWAERNGRVLVTRDWNTMATHLAAHLQSGHHSPGVLAIRPRTTVAELVFMLVLTAYLGDPSELQDQIKWVP